MTQKTIHSAILEAQMKFKNPEKNAENKHFGNRYADLEADIDAVRSALHDAGIYYSQPLVNTEMGSFVKTILHHVESGTELETEIPLLMGKQGMQDLKSAVTYARRIGIENLTGIVASDDDDAETDRSNNPMGAALNDAWRQHVEDHLPANATPRQKATAYANAICEDFEGKGERALSNRWDKHKGIIKSLEDRFPDLHSKVVDAYENHMMALQEKAE